MGNNNKLIGNYVGKVWVQNQDIIGWFATSTFFCAKSHEILI